MYWHEVWLQMDGLGVTMCSSSLLRAFSSSLCFPLKLCLTSLLPFPFMFPPLARSITHWCWFYDLFLWSLSLPLCLSHSESLLVCCWDGRADWMWFILTPESVLWLAQSWHADTHTSWHMRLHTHTQQPFLSGVYSTGWYAAPDTRQKSEQAPNTLELQRCDVIRHGGYRLCLFTD